MTLSVEAARRLVGLKPGDASRDARLTQLVSAAYEQAAAKVGPLSLISVTETGRVFRGQLVLRRPPVQSLTSIGGAAVPSGVVVHAREGLVEGLPSYMADGQIVVNYLCGHAVVPDSVEEGVRAWVLHRWQLEAHGSATYGEEGGPATDFTGLPNSVLNAWGPYLLLDVGIA